MRIEKFEDIIVWQKSKDLVIDAYRTFENCRDYSFRDQIQRASVSVMNNIAEGYERKGNKEFGRFLFIAKGSSGEIRSMLYLAVDLKYINDEEFDRLMKRAIEISRMLSGLIKKIN